MSGTLVDSNIIIDLVGPPSHWSDWSEQQVVLLSKQCRLIINPIIFAEVSVVYENEDACDNALSRIALVRESLPWNAAFPAGQAFYAYRRQGGLKTSPLPDFFIGAHAEAKRYSILTRDARRYSRYFPGVPLITPDTTH